MIVGPCLRATLRIDFDSWNADVLDPDDSIAFYDDVDWTDRRCTRAVDEDSAPQDQSLEGSLTLGPWWGFGYRPRLFLGEKLRRWCE
jgi:hypothetical protein